VPLIIPGVDAYASPPILSAFFPISKGLGIENRIMLDLEFKQ